MPTEASVLPRRQNAVRSRLLRADLDAESISIMQRQLDPAIMAAVDRMAFETFPHFRFETSIAHLAREIRSAMSSHLVGASWLRDWLAEDITFLGRLFVEMTRAQVLHVRLEGVDDDCCSKFHADNVSFRLVCTYRGPGTEWLRTCDVGTDAPIQHLERGEVAILRGSRAATPERPALLHRSPPICGKDVKRLFLAIDDARTSSPATAIARSATPTIASC